MKIYFDNCTFNRPFDDQRQIRIRIESEAKLHIQEQIKKGSLRLVWSYILDFENNENPFQERRDAIQKWRELAENDIEENHDIISKAKELTKIGLKAKDALYVECAVVGKAEYFLTTDDMILRKLSSYSEIKVTNPMDFIRVLEEES